MGGGGARRKGCTRVRSCYHDQLQDLHIPTTDLQVKQTHESQPNGADTWHGIGELATRVLFVRPVKPPCKKPGHAVVRLLVAWVRNCASGERSTVEITRLAERYTQQRVNGELTPLLHTVRKYECVNGEHPVTYCEEI